LRRMLARQALLRWTHGCEARTWNKWRHEVVRTRKAMKAIKMWKHRAMGRAWRAWVQRVMEKKRLRSAAHKVLARWKVILVFGCLSNYVCGQNGFTECTCQSRASACYADARTHIKRSQYLYACARARRMAHVRRPWKSGMARLCARERRERRR